MTDKNQPTELVQIAKQSGLQQNKIEALMSSFSTHFNQARDLANASKDISVTDETDIEGMQLAREKRLELRKVRIEVENTRKELKEQSLREGKAIDGAANIIKALIVPVEEHLEKQEKFADLAAEKRLNERYENRVNLLSPYAEDLSVYQLKEMSDEAFETLLTERKKAHEDKLAAEKKAEDDRIENERRQKILTDRMIEIAPYRDYVTDTFTLGIDTEENYYQEALSAAKSAKKKNDDEQEQIRQQNAKLADQARKAEQKKQQAEDKLRKEKAAQAEKERKARELAEATQRAKEEADKKALLAPDKEKLMVIANNLVTINFPAVKSNEAQKVIDSLELELEKLANKVRNEAQKL